MLMSTKPATPLLSEAQAQFIVRQVSILVGSCDARCQPSVVRAYGCRVSADRHTVTVFLAVAQSRRVLQDLNAGGAIAVVFSRPSTHETLQIKGTTAQIVPLEKGDRKQMQAYGRSFSEEIANLGCGERFSTAIMSGIAEEAVGVIFTPTAAFDQTPGPHAGSRLDPSS